MGASQLSELMSSVTRKWLHEYGEKLSVVHRMDRMRDQLGKPMMFCHEEGHTGLLTPCEMPKWLEREFTDLKVCGSNPTRSASRLPLSRLGQPGSIPALRWQGSWAPKECCS
ncbi:hypothetical protein CSKR_109228 [Clonorchis sinensis]|uniref:Uncharacterized protein n=1 Tax=Clonorchis sinensis TaxID=79923 RepID=A0A419QGG3_CLOSI|nr:hypothetical protein CSKR_109228 [Clonorchis sinensis]